MTDRTRNLRTTLAAWFDAICIVFQVRADAPQFKRIKPSVNGCPQCKPPRRP
jgi:hypothetical protein